MSAESIPELDAKGLRRFALTTGVTVALLFGVLLPWILGRGYRLWPWAVFLVLGCWGLAAPTTLRFVYRAWMRLGLLLNKITTPVIMGALFFLVIVPVGFVMRAFGSDPMHREVRSESKSYRLPSSKPPRENFERPF